MRAIILAAGDGTRIKSISGSKPKCLLTINGMSLISRQVNLLRGSGVDEFVIVVGFKNKQVMEHLKGVERVTYVLNKEYKDTNTFSSYRLALKETGCDECLLLNGDVVFEKGVAELIMSVGDPNAAVVKMGRIDDEAVKVSVDAAGDILRIGKIISNPVGEAIGVYKFSRSLNSALRELDDNPNLYYEDIIDGLLPFHEKFVALDINGLFGAEIDCEEDYNFVLKAMKGVNLALRQLS